MSRQKREGDGATPAGEHRIIGALYRADRLRARLPWAQPIGPRDLWSDDVADENYNSAVRAPHPFSHEHLRRSDPLYDFILLTDWNMAHPRPGHGSAIFIHQWRRPGYPTEGCIALSRIHLHRIACQIRPGTKLIVPGASFWS